MKTEKYEMYFSHINSFLQGKGLQLEKMQQTEIPGFIIFCQKMLSKEISDTITYQIINEITS